METQKENNEKFVNDPIVEGEQDAQLASVELNEEMIDAEEEDATASQTAFAYDKMARADMVKEFEVLLKKKPIQELRAVADALKVAFYKKMNVERQALLQAFLEQGGERESFVAPLDEVEEKLKSLLALYREKRADWMAKQEEEKLQNLTKKRAVITALEALHERTDDFGAVFKDFKQLQVDWKLIGAIPLSEQKDLWAKYAYQVERFYDFVKINRELRELDFKKNFELKQLLCEKAEQLVISSDVVDAFKQLQKMHEQWRDIGPAAPEFREAIWERFKLATVQVNKRHQDYFEEQKKVQLGNLEAKKVLCVKAAEIAQGKYSSFKDWTESTNALLKLQEVWRTIGATPRKDSAVVFQDFRNSCNLFFDARRVFFKEQKGEFSQNLQQKLELCVQAEALAESTEWKKTTEELLQLQAQWKTIGTVDHRQSELVWQRFRAACNKFFDRKKEHFAVQDATYDENLRAKEQVLQEIKNVVPSENQQENLDFIKKIQTRWTEIGFVPKKHKERIQTEYRQAIDELYKALQIEGRGQARPQNHSGANRRQPHSEREQLKQQLKKIQSDILLWENNLGFFGRSKNADSFIADVKRNIEKAQQQVVQIEEKLKLLDA
ncbi:MAG: DUF349 domain-containing protein [Bacteroidales bacterium]